MRIKWTDPALESLRNLHGYIAKDSEIYASRFVQRIILAVEKLTDFPRSGRLVPEADDEKIRELLYRIKGERIKGEMIEILTIIHGGRDLSSGKPAPWDVVD